MWAILCGFVTSRLVQLTVFQRTKGSIDQTSDSHIKTFVDLYSFRLFMRSHSISRSAARRWACFVAPLHCATACGARTNLFGAYGGMTSQALLAVARVSL